jgi:isoleucyl-tRNA synthetase
MFKDVKTNVNFPELEREILAFWREQEIFQKSVAKPTSKGDYIFYEGPPTANGKPGIHHVISRCYKDLFPRFKTMQGYRVGRKGGWDTHGLPVEIAVEKRLGFTRKTQIDEYGIDKFNALAREWVFENIQDWNDMTERIGFWLDLDNAYVTYTNDYIESCWWVLKELWNRGLLGEDYKTTWHCPRNNTSLASHEVSLGYREDTVDPSVYPKFPAVMEGLIERGIVTEGSPQVYLMAWTTTPWTLAANTALAVKPDADYALFEAPRTAHDETATDLYIMVESLAEAAFGEGKYQLLKRLKGDALVGLRYQPILRAKVPEGENLSKGYRVIADASVTTDDGTGILHVAPAYGDLEIGKAHGLPTIFSVSLLGEVFPEVRPLDAPTEGDGPYTGEFFKSADKAIARDLLQRGLLYRETTITHTYPFNWRDGTPLINYAKKSWYIRTSKLREMLVKVNQQINWVPEHIRDGRFGNWLENNIDWALSRERYWGCPLPIWEAEDGAQICVGSLAELAALSGRDLSGLELHRPYVDEVTFEKDGKLFKRVPYTVDVWFESGAMPYAQWHYLGKDSPPEVQTQFERNFPADYICEAIDQTRGWFYSLHALATLLTYTGDDEVPAGPLAHLAPNSSAFKNVICLGHILDEKGEKMSKSKGNIVEPDDILNKYGADALRWYMYSSAPPGNSRRFAESGVAETLRDFLLTLWNSYSFFVLYANLDKPDLSKGIPVRGRPEIDRWLTAKTHALVRDVTAMLESYDPTSASRAVRDFVVDELSNWYVRRNRRRFWKSESDSDKLAAYATLYETLVTVSKLIAPMAPFISEVIYQNLVLSVTPNAPESVHLSDWPTYDAALIDEALLRDMNALLRVVELGRSARNTSGVKVRQPLPEVLVRVRSEDELAGLKRLESQLLEELNVKSVRYLDVHADFVNYTVKPNLPLVGKRLGKLIPELRKVLAATDGKEIARNVREGQMTELTLSGDVYSFEPEAFLLDAQSPEGYAAMEDRGYLAALSTALTPELIQEGLARDVVRLVQNARKNAGLEVSDTIALSLVAEGDLRRAISAHAETIKREVLASSLTLAPPAKSDYQESADIDGEALHIAFAKSAVAASTR